MHEDIEAAERGDGFFDQPLATLPRSQIGPDGVDCPPVPLQFRGQFISPVRALPEGESDLGACAGENPYAGGSDPPGTTGDKGPPVNKIDHHGLQISPVRGYSL